MAGQLTRGEWGAARQKLCRRCRIVDCIVQSAIPGVMHHTVVAVEGRREPLGLHAWPWWGRGGAVQAV
eukprot:gene20670-biopygen16134